MTDWRKKIDSSKSSNRPRPSWVKPPLPRVVELDDHPELISVVQQAVDDVIASNHTNRQRDPDLIIDVERAAAAAALTTYERMVFSAIQAAEAASKARRARAPVVAATAKGIAEVVTDTATEMNHVEEAAANHVARIAAKAAAELAALVKFEDGAAAATAAALVVKAVSEAAAINTVATADAAASVAQAAADAAAEVADEAASTALAAEQTTISTALERHQDALQTCYEVAAAAAQAVLTHHTGADPFHPQQDPKIHKRPA